METPEEKVKQTFDELQGSGDYFKDRSSSTKGDIDLSEKWPWLLLIPVGIAILYGIGYVLEGRLYTESMGPAEKMRVNVILMSSVWAFILGGMGLYSIVMMQLRKKWPTTLGRVVKSSIILYKRAKITPGRTYVPQVIYTYKVGGLEHGGDKIFHYGSGVTASRAAKLASKYPPKSEVDVYYKPGQPEKSVLEPVRVTSSVFFLLFSAVFLVAMAIMAYYNYGPFA